MARYRIRHRDGSWRWVEATWRNLLEEPAVGAVVVNRRDITAEVEAQQRLEERVAERTRELTALLEVARQVGSTLELKPLLQVILDQLALVDQGCRPGRGCAHPARGRGFPAARGAWRQNPRARPWSPSQCVGRDAGPGLSERPIGRAPLAGGPRQECVTARGPPRRGSAGKFRRAARRRRRAGRYGTRYR